MSVEATHGYPEASFEAEEAMANLYRGIKLGTGANQVLLNAANSTMGIGVNQVTASSGGPVTVQVAGFTLAYCSGGWTKGDKLTAGSAGVLATTTTAAHLVCAIAMETVSDTEYGEVYLVSPALRYDSF